MIDSKLIEIFGNSEYIPGFDPSQLSELDNATFANKYAELEVRITPTKEAEELKDKLMVYYNKELLTRIANEKIHPDDFQKMVEKHLEEINHEVF